MNKRFIQAMLLFTSALAANLTAESLQLCSNKGKLGIISYDPESTTLDIRILLNGKQIYDATIDSTNELTNLQLDSSETVNSVYKIVHLRNGQTAYELKSLSKESKTQDWVLLLIGALVSLSSKFLIDFFLFIPKLLADYRKSKRLLIKYQNYLMNSVQAMNRAVNSCPVPPWVIEEINADLKPALYGKIIILKDINEEINRKGSLDIDEMIKKIESVHI